MAHYAQIDTENIVIGVVVVPEEHDHRGQDYLVDDLGLSGTWIKTSYNTSAGNHSGGGEPFRKNYAAIGHVFDAGRDAFIPPKPFPSWSLNEESCLWESPTPMPLDEKIYEWDEAAAEWIERVI
jgi:hypothetical protein